MEPKRAGHGGIGMQRPGRPGPSWRSVTAGAALAGALGALLMGLCGCASSGPSSSGARAGGLEWGAVSEPSGPGVSAIDAYPFLAQVEASALPGERVGLGGAMEAVFDIVDGPDAGGTMLQERAPGTSPGSWVIRRRIEGRDELFDERTLSAASDGGVVLEEVVNHARGVRVEMRPPPVSMPALLAPGELARREMTLRLPRIDRPASIRERGTGVMELRFIGEREVRLGGAWARALGTREVFTSKLQHATAVRTIDRWAVPGVGLVAEEWTEEVRALGLVIERSRLALHLRVSPSGAAPVPGPAAPALPQP